MDLCFFSIYRFDDTIYTCVGSSTVPYVTSIGNTLLDVRLSKPCSVMTKNDLELLKSTIMYHMAAGSEYTREPFPRMNRIA